MYHLVGGNELDLEALRVRLLRMSDDAVNRFGQAARYMYSPVANHGKRPRRVFIVQLRAAVEEWPPLD